jgi:hypothetical protein
MLTVTYSECHIYALHAESNYAECHYAECHYAVCQYVECCGALKYGNEKPKNALNVKVDW